MQQENKVNYNSRRKTSKRQTIWNFMRRNPNFRVSEVMMICDVSYSYFQKFLRFLEKAEYVRFTGKRKKPYSNREYRLIRNSGVKAPRITDYGLYDFNTSEAIRLIDNASEPQVKPPDNLIKILSSIDCNELTQEQLAQKADLKVTAIRKWWNRLQKIGVITGRIKANLSHLKEWERVRYGQYKLIDKKYVYGVNQERVKVVLYELEKGAYTHTNAELRHLWLKQ